MVTSKIKRIPVHKVPAGTMLAELDQKMRKYELRYEMSSDKMAALLEMDAIRFLRWYSLSRSQMIREKTRTTGGDHYLHDGTNTHL